MKKIAINLMMSLLFAVGLFTLVAGGTESIELGACAGTLSFGAGSFYAFKPFLLSGVYSTFAWIGSSGEFKKLSGDEIKELSEEDARAYLKALHEYALEEAKFSKELAEKHEEYINELKEQLKDYDTVKEELNKLALAVKSLSEKPADKSNVDFKGALKVELEKHAESLAKMATKEGKNMSIVVKVPATMTTANVSGAAANPALSNQHLPGFMLIPERNPFILEFIDYSSTTSSEITWAEERNPEGDAQFTAEGELKPLLDFEIETVKSSAKKVAATIKVSTEMLKDVDFLAAEIDRRLRKKHDLRMEDGILNGDGTGANLLGITPIAAAYIGANPISETIADANNFDAIRAVIAQIVNSSDGMYYPTEVFINQYDGAAMDLSKAADGHYTMPPFVVATPTGQVTIKGVRVIEKTKIPQGYFLVGDMSKSHAREYEGFEVVMGYENDDFTKNLVTLLGESRMHHFIGVNEYSAFVYDQFATVIADLDPEIV